jgi:hypothetical protein
MGHGVLHVVVVPEGVVESAGWERADGWEVLMSGQMREVSQLLGLMGLADVGEG